MKKVAFLALHLGYGGAERAIVNQANLLSEFCNVEIICFYKLYDNPAFHISENVKVTYLTENIAPNKDKITAAYKNKNIPAFIKESAKAVRILYMRRHLMKKAIKNSCADIIISSRYIYHRLLTENAKKGVICIAQEHNHHNNNEKYIAKQIRAVANMDYFMPVSEELCSFYSKRVRGKVKCIYIPHHLESMPETLSPLTGKSIISVGRLEPVKGMDELIEVFSEVHHSHPDWKLNIVGDGSERGKLTDRINRLNLNNSVILHGYKSPGEITELLMKSSIYVMTSHSESFGLVLIEAQSCGVPCIAFDSARGAAEILNHDNSGILIKNRSHTEMVAAIEKLISDFEYRKDLGIKGRKNAERYSYSEVKQQWEQLIG